MNKQAYLERVGEKLKYSLTKDEYDSVMQYYDEYFDDAGEENAEAVIRELGAPEALAAKIIGENKGGANGTSPSYSEVSNQYSVEGQSEPKKKLTDRFPLWAIILVTIVTFPLWVGVFGAAFGLLIGAFGIVIGFFAGGVSLMFASLAVLVTGIIMSVSSLADGFIVIGVAFICFALGLCFFLLATLIVKGITTLIKYLVGLAKGGK